jgi:hypothetical protein
VETETGRKKRQGIGWLRQNTKFIVARGGKKTLHDFNIRVGDRRTSVRLSPVVADAVKKIAARERCELGHLRELSIKALDLRYRPAFAYRDWLGYL